MPYTLHPLTNPSPPTFPTLSRIFHAAFSTHPIDSALFANVPRDILAAYDVRQYTKAWERREEDGWRWFVVRYRNDEGERDEAGMAYGNEHETGEGEGEIVAWAKWQYPHPFAKGNEQRGRQWPEGANVELWEEFFGKMEERKRRWVGEGEYFLDILAVHPSHQRRGLGSLLIRPGLEAADRDNASTYVEASAQGLPLYLKHGWEAVGEMVVDMREYGGQEVVREKVLMRAPQGKKK